MNDPTCQPINFPTRQLIAILCFLSVSLAGFSQHPWEMSAEYQQSFGKGYNGHMAGGRFELFPGKSSWSGGITYNFSAKKTYSQYKGFGIYAGWRYGFGSGTAKGNAFAGARILFSFDNFDGKAKVSGLTITPTAEAGYHLLFGKHLFTAPAIGFGYSMKMNHEYNSLQEDEGGRFIPGISAGYRF
jgi:hypothetical protein